MQTILDSFKWRYATKQYDAAKKITNEQLTDLLESVQLAPTSYGLQAFKVLVITNPEIRAKLRTAAWDQPQVTDASHFIVFTVPTNLSESHVDQFIHNIAKVRNVTVESLKEFGDMMKNAISHRTPEQRIEWLSRQTYIALGFLLSTAALEHIDATPMEGFDPQQFNEILDLSKENSTVVVAAAIGFRSEEDSYATLGKVRFSKEEMIREI